MHLPSPLISEVSHMWTRIRRVWKTIFRKKNLWNEKENSNLKKVQHEWSIVFGELITEMDSNLIQTPLNFTSYIPSPLAKPPHKLSSLKFKKKSQTIFNKPIIQNWSLLKYLKQENCDIIAESVLYEFTNLSKCKLNFFTLACKGISYKYFRSLCVYQFRLIKQKEIFAYFHTP